MEDVHEKVEDQEMRSEAPHSQPGVENSPPVHLKSLQPILEEEQGEEHNEINVYLTMVQVMMVRRRKRITMFVLKLILLITACQNVGNVHENVEDKEEFGCSKL